MRALVLLLMCLVASLARAEQRVALVIGNSAYTAVATLPNPANDARAVAESLRRLGFEVTALTNGDKRAMDEALRAFGRRAAAAEVAMVFYAGHGVQVDGRNYLVPVDAHPPQQAQDLRYDFVDVGAVMDELSGARRLRIVVLDACRDNPIATQLNRSLGRALGGARGLAAPADMDNTLIAYATAADATAADGEGAHSPFTEALLEHIGDPGLDIRLMFGRVRDKVRRATANRQNPFVYVSLGGDSFAFNPGAAPPAAAEPAPTPGFIVGLQHPLPPVPVPVAPPPRAVPGIAELLGGRWQHGDGRGCGGGLFGTVTVLDGALRFEWRLPGGRLNVAIERITGIDGNVVSTTVVSDVGTPRPEVGNRNRYTIEDGRWLSLSLSTGERAVHVRC
jgi:hypothetical protein